MTKISSTTRRTTVSWPQLIVKYLANVIRVSNKSEGIRRFAKYWFAI